MLTNFHISRTLREIGLRLPHDINVTQLQSIEINRREYSLDEFPEFKRDLFEAANKVKLLLIEFSRPADQLIEFVKDERNTVLLFHRQDDDVAPMYLSYQHLKQAIRIEENGNTPVKINDDTLRAFIRNERDEVIFYVISPYQTLASEYAGDDNQTGEKLTPVKRLIRLLQTEKRDIIYISFYAVIIGLISLILPLGIQATVELISGGVFFSSVYVLIALVILGVLFSGGLQLVQISLVEYLQRRVFAKAALEFAFRIPRIRIESLFSNYAPELVNRFFDIMTIQKGLPKLLIDLSSGTIQILFGLLLLSLYHPFFVFFSIVLLLTLFVIFYFTGPKGLNTSIHESKYKYKVAHWLEELARAINSFKLAGNTDLPISRTDNHVSSYLKYRKSHFQILITQFTSIILFKAIITGGLLIMGTILVVNREITLGQFVASEVIIILILNSVEKIIMYMDVVYDLITAIDKVSQVTDLPLERTGGIDIPKKFYGQGYAIEAKELSYQYPNASQPILNNISLAIKPGEHVCLAGPGGSGKSTLTNILAGLQTDYRGVLTINNFSMRDLDLTHLRDKIAKNISQDDIFDGTILENITVGKPLESPEDAVEALQKVKLNDQVNMLPHGLHTALVSGGKGYSSTFISRLILARCLAKHPELIILNDFFIGMKKSDKLELIHCLTDKSNHWTLVAVSNDPLIMAACDRVIVLSEGTVVADSDFETLMKEGRLTNYME
jgi:ABC-type bacteriocin/lantibiotic exporter with double-glycine peptidase domain